MYRVIGVFRYYLLFAITPLSPTSLLYLIKIKLCYQEHAKRPFSYLTLIYWLHGKNRRVLEEMNEEGGRTSKQTQYISKAPISFHNMSHHEIRLLW